MNARRVTAAAGVIHAAMKTKQKAAGIAAALEAAGLLQPPETAASPWERAVAGLNALVDADIAFWIEPDGHISGPFGDEHIQWDQDASRWRLVHDDEDDVHPSHPAPCRVPASPDCTCPSAESAEAEALAAVDRSIAAQFPAVTAFLAEDPHDSPLHHDYATPHDLPEYRFCGGTLANRTEYPFTCNRRVAHQGPCSGELDAVSLPDQRDRRAGL